MAHAVAPGSQVIPPPPQHQAPHGTKRAAESSLEHEQRLSKRFDLLNLVDNNGTRLYIPVPGSSSSSSTSQSPNDPVTGAHPLAATLPLKRRIPRAPRPTDMQVEDTPHRVYISDLAAELSDIESDEEHPIFLPDIEKHLSKIPKHVLLGPEPEASRDNQLVLYSVPESLSVRGEADGVRRAIVEARKRIREGMGSAVGEVGRGVGELRNRAFSPAATEDGDAMDID